ncbi:hypothetical protein AXXA_05643 [Achromobacter insuavis AXX-A]|uniref:Uncharacterized protein n=1 Tax=Achromobacter insuavis AXX-A TaxID=1003200 RepID=F7SXJ8_9BURK|nr:hypothetical protein AXXA_05643 [Achromobacter insuavis AXX-A]
MPSPPCQASRNGWPGRAGKSMSQAAAPPARDARMRVACANGSAWPPAAIAGKGAASIHRVIGSRKTLSVPVNMMAHSSQPQTRPHQVCSQAMLWRKPAFMPTRARAGGGPHDAS